MPDKAKFKLSLNIPTSTAQQPSLRKRSSGGIRQAIFHIDDIALSITFKTFSLSFSGSKGEKGRKGLI